MLSLLLGPKYLRSGLMEVLVDEEAKDRHVACQDYAKQGVCLPCSGRIVHTQNQTTQSLDPKGHIFALEEMQDDNAEHPTHDYRGASEVRRYVGHQECSGCGRSARDPLALESRSQRLTGMRGETVRAEILGTKLLNLTDDKPRVEMGEQCAEAIDAEDEE